MQDASRNTLIIKITAAVTILLLLLTVLVSWGLNIFHTDSWFLRALFFIALTLFLIWTLCLHIKNIWLRGAVAVILIELIALYAGGRLVSFYYQGESFNEEFFFHFNPETFEFALTAFPEMLAAFFIYILVMGLCAYTCVCRIQTISAGPRTFLIMPAFIVVLAIDPDLFRLVNQSLQDVNSNRDMQLSNIDWEGLNLNRNALYKMDDDIVAGKNVVMIYLEGMERMYSDENVFPGLTPFINSISESALQFEQIYQARGTTFTVAGLLSSQCGTPLLFPKGPGGNDILKNGFLQEGFCLGDILNAGGYKQLFMGGASTRFAGKGFFLSAHGWDEVLGLEELQPLMENPDYLNRWGLFDDTLLSFAESKFDELAANPDQPFNFGILTVDTHPPDGHLSESCAPYSAIDNNVFHAIHCTDQLLEKFIGHMQQSPAWENTVVLMMSDHLHMRNTGMEFYPENYNRRLFVNILNAGVSGKVDTRGTHMDIAPTLLSLMGVKHQQSFLVGEDLLSPAAENRTTNPNASALVSAIRYINTNLLSRLEIGLCEADPVYSFEEQTLRVAGREVDLSLRGRSLPLESLGSTHILMTLVSQEGKVGLTFPVNMENLDYVLFQFRESNFFLLLPSEIAQHLNSALPDFDGLGLLFGSLGKSFDILQSGISLNQGVYVDSDCGDLLSIAELPTNELNMEGLGRICNFTVPEGNSWDDSNGRIRLNNLSYGNQPNRFEVVLQRDDKGWYSVSALEEIITEEPTTAMETCHVYYANQEILIPGIDTENGPSSMILNKIPGVPLTFEMGIVTPLSQTN